MGILLSNAPIAWVCLRGAEAPIKSTVRLMVIETLVVVALSITILVVKSSEHGTVNLSPFNPERGVTDRHIGASR